MAAVLWEVGCLLWAFMFCVLPQTSVQHYSLIEGYYEMVSSSFMAFKSWFVVPYDVVYSNI